MSNEKIDKLHLTRIRGIYNMERTEIQNRLNYLNEKITELDIKLNGYAIEEIK